MDKTFLVESDFRDGEILIKALDEANIPVHSAFWLYDEEEDRWRFMVASKVRDFSSPTNAYKLIWSVFEKMKQQGITIGFSLENISVISPNHPLIHNFHKTIKTGPKDVDGIRISRNRIGDTYIEDAYIYRMQ